MDQLFIEVFHQLTPQHLPRVQALLPEIDPYTLEYSLVAMGMMTTQLLRRRIERLAGTQYTLSVQRRDQTTPRFAVSSVHTASRQHVSPTFVWQTLLYLNGPQMIRPQVLELLRLCASTAQTGEDRVEDANESGRNIYTVLSHSLQYDHPWSDLIHRHARLPIKVLETAASA